MGSRYLPLFTMVVATGAVCYLSTIGVISRDQIIAALSAAFSSHLGIQALERRLRD